MSALIAVIENRLYFVVEQKTRFFICYFKMPLAITGKSIGCL